MIGGRKPRAGGIGVNANEVEDLPISVLLSPLTTRIPLKSVGARRDHSVEAARTVATATRACSRSLLNLMQRRAKGFAIYRKLTESETTAHKTVAISKKRPELARARAMNRR